MPANVYRDGGVDPALLWNPFSMFDQLERVMFGRDNWFDWPQISAEDTEDELLLTADMPGMHEDDVDVTVSGSLVIIRGERKPSNRARRGPFGTFERRFKIADGYDLEHIEAELAQGVLSIRIPKLPKAKPRRIKLAGTGVLDKVKGLLGGDGKTDKSDKTEDK